MNPQLSNGQIIEICRQFLNSTMSGDTSVVDELASKDIAVTVPGGSTVINPDYVQLYHMNRYKWMKSSIDTFEVCRGDKDVTVFCLGTLHGEWQDGTPFHGNRLKTFLTYFADSFTGL